VLIEPIIAAFVAAYATVVALGHVLLIDAICKRPREDDTDWRGGRRTQLRSSRRRCVMRFSRRPATTSARCRSRATIWENR